MITLLLSVIFSIQTLLQQFDNATLNRQYDLADSIFALLDNEQFLDDPILISSSEVGKDSLRGLVYYWAAEYLYNQNEYRQAEQYGLKALPYNKHSRDTLLLTDNLSIVAISCLRQSKYEEALNYLNQCYTLDKQVGDKSRISSDLNSIAGVYFAAKRPNEAETYINKAIEVNKTIDEPQRMAVLLGTLSEIQNAQGNYQEALCNAKKSLKIEQKLGRQGKIGIRLSEIATAQMGLEKYADALNTLYEAIPILENAGNLHSAAICYKQVGDILVRQSEFEVAVRYYEQALTLFRYQGDVYNECNTERGLYNALRSTDAATALTHLENADRLSAQLYNSQTGALISQYNAYLGNDLLNSEILLQRQHKAYLYAAAVSVIVLMILLLCGLWIVMHRSIRINKERYQKLEKMYSKVVFSEKTTEDGQLSDSEKQFLSKIINTVNEQLEVGKADVESVANALCMTTSQLRRRLTAITGESPKTYILYISMQKAKYLLLHHTELSVNEVAIRCGYEESSSFIHTFRKICGVTPAQFRKGDLSKLKI